jgi:hypothetical protein
VEHPEGLGNTSRIILGAAEFWPARGTLPVPVEVESSDAVVVADGVTMTGGTTGLGNLTLLGDQSGITVDGAAIAHDGSLTLAGHNVTFNTPNSYTGQTIVRGTVLVNHADALGTPDQSTRIETGGLLLLNELPNEDMEIAGGALELSNTTTAYGGTITLLGGAIDGPGTTMGRVVLTGEGPAMGLSQFILGGTFDGPVEGFGLLELNVERFVANFNAANTYSGVTELHRGPLNVNHSSGLGTTDAGTIVHGGTLNLNAATDEPITLVGFGTVSLNAPWQRLPVLAETADGFVVINVSGEHPEHVRLPNVTLQVNADTSIAAVTLRGDAARVFVTPNNTLTLGAVTLERGSFGSSPDTTGSIRVDGAIRKQTEGTARLGNIPDFAGEITVDAGILEITNSSGLGTPQGVTTVASSQNAALRLNAELVIEDVIRLNNSAGFEHGGGLLAANPFNLDPTRLTGNVDLGTVGSYIGGNRDESTLLEIAGPVSGGSLNKVGPRMILALTSSANSYNGATNVREGDFILRGEGHLLTSSEIVIQRDARFTSTTGTG